jgi:hypothetical protein
VLRERRSCGGRKCVSRRAEERPPPPVARVCPRAASAAPPLLLRAARTGEQRPGGTRALQAEPRAPRHRQPQPRRQRRGPGRAAAPQLQVCARAACVARGARGAAARRCWRPGGCWAAASVGACTRKQPPPHTHTHTHTTTATTTTTTIISHTHTAVFHARPPRTLVPQGPGVPHHHGPWAGAAPGRPQPRVWAR